MSDASSSDVLTTITEWVFFLLLEILALRHLWLGGTVIFFLVRYFASVGKESNNNGREKINKAAKHSWDQGTSLQTRRRGTKNEQGIFHRESQRAELLMHFELSESMSNAMKTGQQEHLDLQKDKTDSLLEEDVEVKRKKDTKRCHCRLTGKSASWGEADSQAQSRRRMTTSESDQPIAVNYYYGKLIQVSSSNQVQIGDHCHMEVSDEGFMSDENGLCFNCRRRLLYDETGSPQLCDFPDPDSVDPSPASSPSHSQTLRPGVHLRHSPGDTSDDCRDLTEDEGESPTMRSRLASVGPQVSVEEREQLFVEARLKIYNAAKELRSSPNFDRVGDRKSLRKLLKKKKKSQ